MVDTYSRKYREELDKFYEDKRKVKELEDQGMVKKPEITPARRLNFPMKEERASRYLEYRKQEMLRAENARRRLEPQPVVQPQPVEEKIEVVEEKEPEKKSWFKRLFS